MAIKKIEIRPKGDGSYSDVLYPRTSIDQVDGLQASLDSKEPAFTKNTAFNKNFGTTAGTVCAGDDSRLSNSRKCNNTFDNAATARTNLGVAQTRVYNGKLQYYDGGWKDVSALPTHYASKYGTITIASNSSSTVLNISGKGVLNRVSIDALWAYNLDYSVIIDGVEVTLSCVEGRYKAVSFVEDNSGKIDSLPNVQFNSSLQIKFTNKVSAGHQVTYYIEYGLF